jgi:integrase/recombinase XerD
MAEKKTKKKKKPYHFGGQWPHEYLNDDQVDRITDYVNERAEAAKLRGSHRAVMTAMLWQFLIRTGLRASEICKVSIRDLPKSHGENIIMVKDAKKNTERSVVMAAEFIDMVNLYIRDYRKHVKPGGRLFISERGNPLTRRALYKRIRRLGDRCGFTKGKSDGNAGYLHPHRCRHTMLSLLYKVKKDIVLVQATAGHKDIRTTQIYAKTDRREATEQTEAMTKAATYNRKNTWYNSAS